METNRRQIAFIYSDAGFKSIPCRNITGSRRKEENRRTNGFKSRYAKVGLNEEMTRGEVDFEIFRTKCELNLVKLCRVNDSLSELNVPPPGKERVNYPQLAARNKELEATLVPDLEHIRDLELRLEQEQILVKQDEAELANFKEKKLALNQRTRELQRSKLHHLLRDSSLSTSMATLCQADNDFRHLSVADQRLMSLMPRSRDEVFSGADVRENSYNPDRDMSINKVSKRLGNRLSAIECNGEGLDPLLQLVAAAKDRMHKLSATALASNAT
ncbi:hypothetical protein BGX28_001853 [Mortierella sp. GBA30]|nr:hypothetical protein BGX28_001853 [Mortierella sp. GBA30]